jgi:hypothetical protein
MTAMFVNGSKRNEHFPYYRGIPVNLWELLGGDLPPTNSSNGEILCIAFKCTKLYLVVAYMW